MSNDIDLSQVAPSDVAAVLNRAAELVEEHGWTPQRVSGDRITALQAITKACDEVGGAGVDSAELHVASLDAVCLKVFGQQHGRAASVSRWERQTAAMAVEAAIKAQSVDIVSTLRSLAN